MFLILFINILSATNVSQFAQHGNKTFILCPARLDAQETSRGNNVSATMCPRHPASRAFSYGPYALYREKPLHETCQVLVEHAQSVAKIQF